MEWERDVACGIACESVSDDTLQGCRTLVQIRDAARDISACRREEMWSAWLLDEIKTSHDRMHTAEEHELIIFRKIYTDACIVRALALSLNKCYIEAISSLDHAIIIAGPFGAGRLGLILDLIQRIQAHIPSPSQKIDNAVVAPSYFSATHSLECTIPCLLSPPSFIAFQSSYSRSPFILRNYAADWPALQEHPWKSAAYLRSVAGPGRVVPVEVGSDYRSDDWEQKLMPWDDFLSYLDLEGQPATEGASDVLYLAQHNLMRQFPLLRDDIVVPDYVYASSATLAACPGYNPPSNEEQLLFNTWLGPSGTVSPAHIVVIQSYPGHVHIVCSPGFGPESDHPGGHFPSSTMANTSRIDVFSEDQNGFPGFEKNVVLVSMTATLDPGDMLFFPPEIGPPEVEELAYGGQHRRQEADSIVERLALKSNRICSLPSEFALLSRLRYLNLRHNLFSVFPDVVLCLSHNKLARLPSYLAQFRHLELFQVDRNPIEWPPPAVLESFGDLPDLKNGQDWIRKLQNWLDGEGSKGRDDYDDSGYGERPELENERIQVIQLLAISCTRTGLDPGLTPHARSFSIDSATSLSSILESSYEDNFIKQNGFSSAKTLNHTEASLSGGGLLKPSDFGDVYSATSSQHGHESIPVPDPMHLRTASHASSLRKPQSSSMGGKKSLPDLRSTPKGPAKRMPVVLERKSPFPPSANGKISEDIPTSSTPLRQDSGSSSASFPSTYPEEYQGNTRVLPLVAAERNSYFRRSSTIRTSQPLPKSLKILLECSRSILFAMGQLYQTLEQYVQHGTSNHLTSSFKKILDPANVNMLHLIRSLDRFDDVCQKSTPSPAVCRGLVESCRDTVTVFRKGIGSLNMPTSTESSDDARYVRWLIIEVYATTAELSFAWQTMVPHINTLKPYLYGTVFSQTTSYPLGADTLSSTSRSHPGQLAPSVRLRPIDGLPSGGRVRTSRRHAGSFSSKDVEIGKDLPSSDLLPNMMGGVATHTPTLRTPKRQATATVPTSTPSSSIFPPSPSPLFGYADPSHLRQQSQGSFLEPPLISPSTSQESPGVKPRANKDVLQAIQGTIEVAPTVWDQIEEALSDTVAVNPELRVSLDRARSVTKRLSDDILAMSEGFSSTDKRVLREDAHLFLKTLVQLSNMLKTKGDSHPVPSALRANMVKLTNSTEQFAVLLHVPPVSSYPPRSTSPTSNLKYAPYNASSYPMEDNQLPSSLSRSKSAQPSLTNAKPSYSAPYESPRTTTPLSIKNTSFDYSPPWAKTLLAMKVIIIGAGPSGLVTCKSLLEATDKEFLFDPIVLEQEESIGGTFRYRSYEFSNLVSSKQLTSFSDFRLPLSHPDHLTLDQYVDYLERYIEHFKLEPRIQLECKVVNIRRISHDQHEVSYVRREESRHGERGGWRTTAETIVADYVAVCAGLHVTPSIPSIPGIENILKHRPEGERHVPAVFHSIDYKVRSQLAGRRVMILGTGETGMDLAYEAVKAGAEQVVLCSRAGFLSIPKALNDFEILGFKFASKTPVPIDSLITNLGETAYVSHKAMPYLNRPYRNRPWYLEYVSRYIDPPEDSPPRTDFVVELAPFPSHILPNGRVVFQSSRRKDATRISKMDIRPDTVVYATGYTQQFDYLDEASKYPVPSDADLRSIAKTGDESIGFIGYVRPGVGAIPPLAEMQAFFWISLIKKEVSLPLSPSHYHLLARKEARIQYGVDHSSYMSTLAKDISAAPGLFYLLLQYGPLELKTILID
ncbi:hypothetical protein NLJ89_g948 [Agrocybe chaxingu]|uniref:Cupin-like domain-containing protein n=1 Tax=Agrocybe chaxingu TaxID=84603 RepID=A0A9W8N115_9AGAR|nr:hypothetical protein NLJ89_g948 [Agrocybe chaxingu]